MLCADDYGLTPGVSRGITDLLSAGRLSATSCMSVAAAWPDAAADLTPFFGRADIGLHLTLTHLKPLGPMPLLAPEGRLPALGDLMRMALTRRLDRGEIAAELERQLDAFVAAAGRPPDFLDGHQHVHILPVIREAVIDLIERRLDRQHLYVRSCREPARAILRRGVSVPKSLLLSALSRDLTKLCRARGIATNDSFRGVNDFRRDRPFGDLFRRFLMGPANRPLVMCHPGIPDPPLAALDAVTDRRQDELDYLAGDRFLQDLATAGWRLGRFTA